MVNSGHQSRLRIIRRACSVAAAALLCSVWSAQAETLISALSHAYTNNPQLNAERANLRSVDELVPQALSGWRPQIIGGGSVSSVYRNTRPGQSSSHTSAGVGVTVDQPLFRGFRTVNSTKEAEATVRAGREALRNVEQNILFQASEAYMDVLRDSAIVELTRRNIEVLSEEERAARDRFEVGEVTRTDVAQAESRVSGAISELNFAESNLMSSRAVYRQVVGLDPTNLQLPGPASALPRSLDEAINLGAGQHPAILAAIYAEEASAFAIKVAEGVLLPTLSIQGSFDYDVEPQPGIDRSETAAVVAQLTVPIYQGGAEYSQVRAAKETRTQRTLEIDSARQQVRAAVLAAWGGLKSATASIRSANSQVSAAEIALSGVREEARVGQRTTLDVLNAERELLDARVSLVIARRDQVVASYALMSAIGQLSASNLGLAVSHYEPTQHYEQVRDKWFGLRTPSGQ